MFKYTGLEIMRLSATDYSIPLNKEYEVLTKLKTHFSLLCDEKDEVNEVEVNYYRFSRNKGDIFISVIVTIVFAIILIYLAKGWG